jgi:hypothetical protein
LFISERPDFAPVELIYRIYNNYGAETNEQKGSTVNENTYMRQLFALANKYEVMDDGLKVSIERTEYTDIDGILKIVSKINHVSKSEYEKAHVSGRPAFTFFLAAGANVDNIKTPVTSPYYNAGGRSATSVRPALSLGVNFFANPSTRQLQFRLEAGVAQSQYNSLYNSKVFPYIPFRASFDELTFNLSPQIIFNFYNTENLKIYGGVGVYFKFYKYSNAYLGSQSQPNSAADIEANNPFFFGTFDNGPLFKVGLQFNQHWGIYGQYLSSSGITKNGYYALTSVAKQVGINYFFR